MSYLAAGVIAFGMFLLYDLNSFTWKNRILHTFFLIGNVILLASTAACFITLIRAYGAPVWRIVIFGALAVSQAALLIYTLFFAPYGFELAAGGGKIRVSDASDKKIGRAHV